MGFDRERYNERAALVLLALLGLRPGDPWSESEARLLRTVDIMGWLRDHWETEEPEFLKNRRPIPTAVCRSGSDAPVELPAVFSIGPRFWAPAGRLAGPAGV